MSSWGQHMLFQNLYVLFSKNGVKTELQVNLCHGDWHNSIPWQTDFWMLQQSGWYYLSLLRSKWRPFLPEKTWNIDLSDHNIPFHCVMVHPRDVDCALDTFKIRLPFGTVNFLLTFWIELHIAVLDKGLPKWSRAHVAISAMDERLFLMQYGLRDHRSRVLSLALSLRHWNSSRFLEFFNYLMHHRRWNTQVCSNLSLRKIIFKNFNSFLLHLLAKWWHWTHLCSWTTAFLDAAFIPNHGYDHLLTSSV